MRLYNCRSIPFAPIQLLDSDTDIQKELTTTFQPLCSTSESPSEADDKKTQKKTNKKNKGGIKQKITEHFREQGFELEDIPKAIVVHELLGILMLAVTWSACFHFPPSQSALLKPHMAKVQGLMPPAVTRFLSSSRILSGKMGASYLESSCMRKLIRPVTLPGKMYVTLMAVRKMSAGRRRGRPDLIAVPLAGLQEERSLFRDVRHVLISAAEEVVKFRSGSSNSDALLADRCNLIL
eukprot:gene31169-41528_t